MHLNYHAKRYGKIAIGFHRSDAIRHGFSPVFYQHRHSATLQHICEGFELVFCAGIESIMDSINELKKELEYLQDKLEPEYSGHDEDEIEPMFYPVVREAKFKTDIASQLVHDGIFKLRTLLAFIKTFDTHEFSTIYCEREWRSTKSFGFDYDDISMIVLPRKKTNYFARFIEDAKTIPLPPTVSVVAWDDLVEH